MPAILEKNQIKDLAPLNKLQDLFNKYLELEAVDGSQNYKAPFALFVQAVNASLGAPSYPAIISVRTIDTNDNHYNAGDATLISESLVRNLVMYMTARVEFVDNKYATKEYRLIPDGTGQFLAYKDTSYNTDKLTAKWVEVNSADDKASGIADFNALINYNKSDNVKYKLNGSLRVFTALQDLAANTFPTSQVPAPTGLTGDNFWSDINTALAPNYSSDGEITCKYYTNAEKFADTYVQGDTVEDLIARENAGANILYTNRTVTVELGAQAGTYRVQYDGSGSALFTAWVDGSCKDSRNPSQLVKVVYGDVTRAYVDNALQAQDAQYAKLNEANIYKSYQQVISPDGNDASTIQPDTLTAAHFEQNGDSSTANLAHNILLFNHIQSSNSYSTSASLTFANKVLTVASSEFNVPVPTKAANAATKDYVDKALAGVGAGSTGTVNANISVFPEYTCASAGVQSISLSSGALGAFDVTVVEATTNAVRSLYKQDYSVAGGVLTISAEANLLAGDKVGGCYYVAGASGGAGGSSTSIEDLLLYTPDSANRVVPLALPRPLTLIAISALAARNVSAIHFQVNYYDTSTNNWIAGNERTTIADAQTDLNAITDTQRANGAEILFKVIVIDDSKSARGIATINY